jgi:CubicO group peptidase (beta-lactamase class C family)
MVRMVYRLEMRSLVVACLVACNSSPTRHEALPAGTAASAEPIAARIDRITHHLLPATRVKGMDWHRDLEDRMRKLHVHGLSIAVFEHYHLAWAKGFGVADVDTEQPVTDATLFQAGSISKAVNALAALAAVEQGQLALDTPINDSLRSWKLGDNDFTRQHAVTLRELLSHTAGTNVHGFLGYRAGAPVPTLVQILDGVPPANTEQVVVDGLPGKEFRYSGGGVSIAQLALVDRIGMPYPELMTASVLGPLGMTHSTYEQPLPASRVPEAAAGYYADGRQVPGKRIVYPEMAAAGLWTTPSDLAAYLIEIQRARAGKSTKISKQIAAEMTTPVAHVEGDDWSGLGLYLMNRDGAKLFGHDGWDEGFQAEALASLDDGYGVVIMANSDNGAEIFFDLERAVFAEYGWPMAPELERVAVEPPRLAGFVGTYGTPGDPVIVTFASGKLFAHRPFDVPVELVPVGPEKFVGMGGDGTFTLDHKLTTTAPLVELEAGHPDVALATWKADRKALTERAATGVGRRLLQRQQPQLAAGVFQLVAGVFPDSMSAHEGLAKGYEAVGDKPHAIASYQAALAASAGDTVTRPAIKEKLRATCVEALARLAH